MLEVSKTLFAVLSFIAMCEAFDLNKVRKAEKIFSLDFSAKWKKSVNGSK